MDEEGGIRKFDDDVGSRDAYAYSGDSAPLSSRIAHARITETVLAAADFRGRKVLDVGCGDGFYTLQLLRAGPGDVLGVDLAMTALARARERANGKGPIRFVKASVYDLAPLGETFDIAVVRAVLHHLDRPAEAIAAIARVAREIVVVEPNGYNPGLKFNERFCGYHREHGEKSYPPFRIDRWCESAGGRIAGRWFIGLVPTFCPEWMARTLKRIEPAVERIPVFRMIACAQYVSRVVMDRPG